VVVVDGHDVADDDLAHSGLFSARG
jgi:hypothetical protein